jgi:predicted DNA-binding protein (MmcQ/YjbR family)
MNAELLRDYCLTKKHVTESFPFDETTLVFKVAGKMFLLISLEGPLSFNAKCDPDLAIELRENYPCVKPGYHMNKTHWNTIEVNGTVSDKLIMDWIDHSYQLVYDSLPKKIKSELF